MKVLQNETNLINAKQTCTTSIKIKRVLKET